MALKLTPEVLSSVYELLRLTRPFKGWRLPHASEVRFKVLKTEAISGDYAFEEGRHIIRLSAARHNTLHAIIMTVAHEMAHMKDHTKAHHGSVFRRLADSICKAHGFDRGQF